MRHVDLTIHFPSPMPALLPPALHTFPQEDSS